MEFQSIITLSHFTEVGTYQYTFSVNEKGIELHSIDLFKKRSSNGKTYENENIYHYEYKKGVYNHETHEWKKPNVPLHILEQAECFRIGFGVKNLSLINK